MNDTNKHLFGRSNIEQKNYYSKTTASEEKVLSILKSSPEVDISDIRTYVHDGEIHLEGQVESIQEKTMVEALITNYFTEKLINHLSIKRDQSELNARH